MPWTTSVVRSAEGTSSASAALLGLVGSLGWSGFELAQAIDSELEIGPGPRAPGGQFSSSQALVSSRNVSNDMKSPENL